MLGTIVNAAAIVLCSLVGTFLIKGIPERFESIIKKALGLSILYLGISGVLENQRVMLLILSMVVGSVLGELLDIDRAMNRLGYWAEARMGLGEGAFAKGFITASLLFCTGSMAIVGSIQSGLSQNHEMLFAKSILDGITSFVLSSALGIGVLFSAVPVFLYQGAITLSASFVSVWLTPEIITEMSAVGSLLIVALSLNFLEVKAIKVANMIPAIFIPWIYIAAETWYLARF